ncbi:MAG: hypothetical protein HY322_12010 [Betaproteobacteria bacterium]|nr:hypothetical protein [Betaproteobacteria bacterium]
MQWWGYSKEHGWVVLDRSIPRNVPGIKEDLLFLRCRDATTFIEKREKWTRPHYTYAPVYLKGLAPADAVEAAAELETFKALWPDFHREVQRVHQEAVDRIEALRIEEEKKAKQAARDRKKQATAAGL